MPYAKPTTITSWSYSRYSLYDQCPLKVKLAHLEKIKEPGSPAMERGNRIHKAAEDYLTKRVTRVPSDLVKFSKELREMRKTIGASTLASVEDTWAFRADWTRTTWDDWNGCWLRIKVDACYPTGSVVEIVDWKTGKFSEQAAADYMLQMELYGLGGLLVFAGRPGLKVRPRLYFTDHGIIYPREGIDEVVTYVPEDLPRLKKLWTQRSKALLNDKKFPPKPNRFCPWCFYRKANKEAGGGQCSF